MKAEFKSEIRKFIAKYPEANNTKLAMLIQDESEILSHLTGGSLKNYIGKVKKEGSDFDIDLNKELDAIDSLFEVIEEPIMNHIVVIEETVHLKEVTNLIKTRLTSKKIAYDFIQYNGHTFELREELKVEDFYHQRKSVMYTALYNALLIAEVSDNPTLITLVSESIDDETNITLEELKDYYEELSSENKVSLAIANTSNQTSYELACSIGVPITNIITDISKTTSFMNTAEEVMLRDIYKGYDSFSPLYKLDINNSY